MLFKLVFNLAQVLFRAQAYFLSTPQNTSSSSCFSHVQFPSLVLFFIYTFNLDNPLVSKLLNRMKHIKLLLFLIKKIIKCYQLCVVSPISHLHVAKCHSEVLLNPRLHSQMPTLHLPSLLNRFLHHP
jgi:hypothetical protein